MGLSKRIWQSDTGDIITSDYVVHSFIMGDVDDPDIYAAGPIYDWERSEMGQWVFKNAFEKPTWHRMMDYAIYGYRYIIKAHLTPEQITFFELKFK